MLQHLLRSQEACPTPTIRIKAACSALAGLQELVLHDNQIQLVGSAADAHPPWGSSPSAWICWIMPRRGCGATHDMLPAMLNAALRMPCMHPGCYCLWPLQLPALL